MIKYRLQCDKGHEFDGWFANSGAYEAQLHAGQLSCVRCDSSNISKAIMAPAIAETGSQSAKWKSRTKPVMGRTSTR